MTGDETQPEDTGAEELAFSLDPARQEMFEATADAVGPEALRAELEATLKERLTELYDAREQLAAQRERTRR